MKVLIIARYGSQVGLGHWSRCQYLANALRVNKHSVRLETVSDEPLVVLPESTPIIDFKDRPDLVVVDDPVAPETQGVDTGAPRIALDFFKNPDGLFVGVICVIEHASENILATTKVRRYVGLEFMILEPVKRILEPPSKTAKVLVVIGGQDIRGWTKQLLRHVEYFPQATRLAVILPDEHRDRVAVDEMLQGEKFKSKFSKIERLAFQRNLNKHLHSDTFVYCNGGSTAALVGLAGVPAVFVPQTEVELDFLARLGMPTERIVNFLGGNEIYWEGQIKDASAAALRQPWIVPEGLDGRGADRIVPILESHCLL